MTTVEVLEKALALIEDEENWTQHRARAGSAFCAIGALNYTVSGIAPASLMGRARAEERGLLEVYVGAAGRLNELAEREGYEAVPGDTCAIATYNNARSHAEVVALFQEAIRAEKQKEGIPVALPSQVEVPA